jgi:hypothetical protein
MNEFKLGHQVIVWDNNNKELHKKGIFVVKSNILIPICIKLKSNEGNDYIAHFDNCEFDPQATQFLTDDIVYAKTSKGVKKAKYLYQEDDLHYVCLEGAEDIVSVKECSYYGKERPKFGDVVMAWDESTVRVKKGKFIFTDSENYHHVYSEKEDYVYSYRNVEIFNQFIKDRCNEIFTEAKLDDKPKSTKIKL